VSSILNLSLLEELRKRTTEIMSKLPRPLEKGVLRTQGQVIGGGKIIETVQTTVQNILATAKEKRPNIIPTVMEKIKTYQPGRRIMELVPGRMPTTTTTTSPPSQQQPLGPITKLLRK